MLDLVMSCLMVRRDWFAISPGPTSTDRPRTRRPSLTRFVNNGVASSARATGRSAHGVRYELPNRYRPMERVRSFPTHSGPSRVLSCRAAFVTEETSHTGGTASSLRHRKRPAVLCPATGGICRGALRVRVAGWDLMVLNPALSAHPTKTVVRAAATVP